MSDDVVSEREPPNPRPKLRLAKAAAASGVVVLVVGAIFDTSWSDTISPLGSVLLVGGLLAWGVGSLARRSSGALQVAVIVEDDDIRVLQGGEQIVAVEKSAVDHARWVTFEHKYWLALVDGFERPVAAIPARRLDRDELTRQLALHRWPAPRPPRDASWWPANTAVDRFQSDQVDHKIVTWFFAAGAVVLVFLGVYPWGYYEAVSDDVESVIRTASVVPAIYAFYKIYGRLESHDSARLLISATFVRLVPPKGPEVVVPREPVAEAYTTGFRNSPVLVFRDVTQARVAGLSIRDFDADEVLAALRRHGWPASER